MSFKVNMSCLVPEIEALLAKKGVACSKGQWLGIWVVSYLLWEGGE